MDLDEYLFRNKMTKRAFGKLIDYDPRYVGQVAEKKMRPGKKFAKRVEIITNGQVSADELLNAKLEDTKHET